MGEDSYRSPERRPIAVRHWAVFRKLAVWLAGRGVSPNTISVAGMGCGIAAGMVLAATSWSSSSLEERVAWLAAALLIQLRLLANMLDGMVAIECRRASPVGELFNEVPDRISDAAILVGAGYAAGGDMTLGYLAACVALFTAYVRAMGKAAGVAQEFCGPMAKQQRMFLVTLVAVYSGLAPETWQPYWQPFIPLQVGVLERRWGLMALALALIVMGGLATAVRRLRRIVVNIERLSK
jgi:phosphatidylglycerophosphate synthase